MSPHLEPGSSLLGHLNFLHVSPVFKEGFQNIFGLILVESLWNILTLESFTASNLKFPLSLNHSYLKQSFFVGMF